MGFIPVIVDGLDPCLVKLLGIKSSRSTAYSIFNIVIKIDFASALRVFQLFSSSKAPPEGVTQSLRGFILEEFEGNQGNQVLQPPPLPSAGGAAAPPPPLPPGPMPAPSAMLAPKPLATRSKAKAPAVSNAPTPSDAVLAQILAGNFKLKPTKPVEPLKPILSDTAKELETMVSATLPSEPTAECSEAQSRSRARLTLFANRAPQMMQKMRARRDALAGPSSPSLFDSPNVNKENE